MPVPKSFAAEIDHIERLADIPANSPDSVYAEYMDNLAKEIDAAGGYCDEGAFLLAFYAKSQKAETGLIDRVPKVDQPIFRFADSLQDKAGQPVAMLKKQGDHYMVDGESFGVVLGEEDPSPVVNFEIDFLGNPDADDKTRMIMGIISIESAWKAADGSIEDDKHIVAVIQRKTGSVRRELVSAATSELEMGIVIGEENIRGFFDIDTYEVSSQNMQESIVALRGMALAEKVSE